MYWTDKENNLIIEYINGDVAQRCHIFNILYPTLMIIIKDVVRKTNTKYMNEDTYQELIIDVYKILPKISLDNINYCQSYIMTSVRNKLIELIIKDSRHYMHANRHEYMDDLNDLNTHTNMITSIDIDEVRNELISSLKQRKSSKGNNHPDKLIDALIEYLLNNNYDYRGSGEYIMNKINVDYDYFKLMCFRLNIPSMPLMKKINI